MVKAPFENIFSADFTKLDRHNISEIQEFLYDHEQFFISGTFLVRGLEKGSNIKLMQSS
ncbi:MAG TPA: hypothetical protein VE594_01505 [Nitrososphaeraceae archaeon]|nr:hypothetical protein [Nitrososphaeraceae archaeon]